MNVVLSTHGLDVGYGGIPIVESVNIKIHSGQVVALLGRNGAGKTTTLRTLSGLLPPISGSMDVADGLGTGALHKRVRSGLGLVTEDRTVVRGLTVADNLRLGGGATEIAYEHFPELVKLKKRKACLLSGGEQQMLALSRAMTIRPKLLLVDELSLGLAPQVVRRLLAALRDAARTTSVGVLLVEQHAMLALKYADYGYVLGRNRVALDGDAADLADRFDEVERSYLSSGGA
jgi:branched-chain amino acid transport system ATP-binding protein